MSTETEASSGTDSNLRKKVLRGSVLELVAYAASYVIRLVSSTVLRSLLFPAAFGLMEVITGLNVGLVMLSDVGIRQAVIQSSDGDDQDFLDVAWTMHVVRACGLWLLAVLLAYPAVLITGEQDLLYTLPVASLTTLLQGLTSTAELTMRRRMEAGWITRVELAAQCATLVTTIVWASLSPTVWALVAGGIVGGTVRVVESHRKARALGYRNRFRWDAARQAQIVQFGKWIAGSSAVYFIAAWTDRLLLVSLVGAAVAGVYATAILISESVSAATERVLHNVFFPLFSRVSQDGRSQLGALYYRTRMRFDVATMGGTGALLSLAPWVVALLFDERYQDAAWMLRILSLRAAIACLTTPCETCLVSLGLSRFGFYQNLLRAACMLIGVPLGYTLAGLPGLVWCATLSGVPSLMFLWFVFHRQGLLRPSRELMALVLFALGAAAGFALLFVLPDAIEVRTFLKVLLGRA